MADEVLRLRATVVSDEALANLRALGREIGVVQSTGGKGAKQAEGGWKDLGKSIKEVAGGFESALGVMGPVGLTLGAITFAGTKAFEAFGEMSKKIVALNYASKELGIGEAALRAFSEEAQKAGIAPEAMMQGLGNFKRNTEDFSMRIGALRSQMIALGAGPVLARINAATTQTEKLKEAFDFKEVLLEADPSGMKARRFFEMMGLGPELVRVSWEKLVETMQEKKPLSDEDIQKAKQYNDALVHLGETWDELKEKAGTKLVPAFTAILKGITEGLNQLDMTPEERKKKAEAAGPNDPNAYVVPGGKSVQEYLFGAPLPVPGASRFGTGQGEAVPGAPVQASTPIPLPPERKPEVPAVEVPAAVAQPSARRSAFTAPGTPPASYGPGQAAPTVSMPEYRPSASAPQTGGVVPTTYSYQPMVRGGTSDDQAARIITVGVYDALIQYKSFIEAGASVAGQGGVPGAAMPGAGMRGRPGAPTEPQEEVPVGEGPMDRSRLNAELQANPDLATRLQTIVQGEVGHGAPLAKQQVQLETIFNRAMARNQTLDQVTQQYTGPGSGGYYPAETFQHGAIRSAKEFSDFQGRVMAPVMAGSDLSTKLLGFPATGNASQGVAARGVAAGRYQRWAQLDPNAQPGQPGIETYVQQETAAQRRRLEASRTSRIDQAIAPPPASGAVNVTVNSNGTKADTVTKTEGDLFQPPTTRQHRQMQRTEDAAAGPLA